jgi:hypothetical protein
MPFRMKLHSSVKKEFPFPIAYESHRPESISLTFLHYSLDIYKTFKDLKSLSSYFPNPGTVLMTHGALYNTASCHILLSFTVRIELLDACQYL